MTGLFDQDAGPASVVGVAVNAGVWKSFDYLWPAALGAPAVGVRAEVPFGRGDRKTLGFVVETGRPRGERTLKAVARRLDAESQLDETLMDLARWIGRYYVAPLGMTLAAMVPTAVGRHEKRTETVVHLACDPSDVRSVRGPKQRTVLEELNEARRQGIEPLTLEQLRHHSQASRATINSLADKGLIRLATRPVTLETLAGEVDGDPFELNEDQAGVLAEIEAGLGGGFGVTLLHGVTGSGKTEVYVRAIRQVVAAGRQAIVLVPEIALATQTLQRLARRLPRVAVLHSALTGAQRAFHYQQIRDGHASTVIGPRSAIFAPTRRLGLIVVDEEHESSYKQDTAPRYHGRDVAIKRASLEGVPVVLGSATPSLESLHNARQGRYALVSLPRRIRGLPMPTLHLSELRKEITPGRVELIGRTLEGKMAAALDRSEQVILLMNRRGYASYVFCPSCQWRMECHDCTRAMVFHQSTGLVTCHYCQATAALPPACPACGGKLLLFGLGIQRIEGELSRKFPHAVVARMDSDTMTSPRQFQRVFDDFAAGTVDVLLGTQMVAKGLDFPKVTLVGVISADTALAIPDFRASERAFQLIVQVAGRAGRGDRPGEVVVQTWNPDDRSIQYALQQDYQGFVEYELPLRKDTDVPPFARMVRFLVRHARSDRAEAGAAKLAGTLRRMTAPIPDVKLIGPMRAGVFKIRKLFRFEILCHTRRPGLLQGLLDGHMHDLSTQLGAEIVVDADPVSLV